MKKAVVVLPTYNEKENVQKIIPLLEDEVFPKVRGYEMAILVADDTSPDGTSEEVRKLQKKYKNIEISSGPKNGLGAAYVRGMSYAVEKMNADVLFEMDADGQHDATKVPEFLKKIDEGNDMIVGTRYSDGGSIPDNWPPQRKAFSIVANLLVRTIFMRFSIHDWTGGYRALTKEVFLKEKTEMEKFNGYIFQISLLHKVLRDKFKVAEVPFHFSDRKLGSSKIAPLGYIVDVLSFVIFTRIKELERFIKFLFVGGTGFIVQIASQEGSVALHVSHPIAVGIGAEAAILSNFILNHFWTFGDTKKIKESSNSFVKLIKFNITSLASIFIQIAAVWLGEKFLGVNMHVLSYMLPTRIVILFPTIIFLVIPLNYLIYNKIIWKTQYLNETSQEK